MGRPPIYTDEIVEAYGEELVEWLRSDPERYWLKDFCIEKRFPSENLSYWSGRNEAFSKSLKMAKDIQESRLVKFGMEKKSNMPIFALKNVAVWRDIQEVDLGDTASEIVKEFAKMVSTAGTGKATPDNQ